MYQIELNKNPYYEENFILENEVFNFLFKWNERVKLWVLSIKNNEEEEILNGKPLILNTNLLKGIQSKKKPKGFLLVLPLSNNIKAINKNNLVNDIGLFYLTEQELLEDNSWQNFKIF
jgi:hypothetical protein